LRRVHTYWQKHIPASRPVKKPDLGQEPGSGAAISTFPPLH
jgi:hypothetical protein